MQVKAQVKSLHNPLTSLSRKIKFVDSFLAVISDFYFGLSP